MVGEEDEWNEPVLVYNMRIQEETVVSSGFFARSYSLGYRSSGIDFLPSFLKI